MPGTASSTPRPSRIARGTLRVFAVHWWRFLLAQVLGLLAVSLVIGVIVAALRSGATDLLAFLSADPASAEARLLGVSSSLVLGTVLVSLPFLVAVVVATAALAAAALSARPLGVFTALRRGIVRVLPVLGAVLIAAALVLVAFVGAPLVVLIGLVGLAVVGIRRAVAGIRHGADAPSARPGLRRWGFVAIPFAVAGRLAAAAALVVPVAVLERGGPWAACRAADRAAQGRRWRIALVMVPVVLLTFGVAVGGTLLGQLIAGAAVAALIGTAAQLLAFPAPVVVAVVLYRDVVGLRRLRTSPAVAPAGGARVGGRAPVIARVAVCAVAALLVPAAVVPFGPAAAAQAADGSHFTVTSDADALDAAVLAGQRDSCTAGGADCTIRAALQLAQTAAEAGASGVRIDFSGAMTIALAGPLSFSPAPAPAAGEGMRLDIDGGGRGVVLDGGQQFQILSVVSETWRLRLAGMTMRNGWAQSGGALVAGVSTTALDGMLFEGNTGSTGGGAVFARSVDVTGSTFLDNSASSFVGSVRGGAIFATGFVGIQNSTFARSGVGDEFSGAMNAGGDVYSEGQLQVVNSTFVDYRRGSLSSPSGGSVRNSVFTTNWTRGGAACYGAFSGDRNTMPDGDTTCPGTQDTRTAFHLLGALDRSGTVPVYPLNPSSGNPAFGQGVDCPAVDALGAPRPEQGCDLGAVEVAGGTTTALSAAAHPSVFGTVELTAEVSSSSGAVPTGSVVFAVDGAPQPAVPLDGGDPARPGTARATLEVAGLAGGSAHTITAAYTPTGIFDPSSGTVDYTVEQVRKPVLLRCVDPDTAQPVDCAGARLRITETGDVRLVASVDDPGTAGSVRLAADAGGTVVLAAAQPLGADGSAAFTLGGAALGLGAHPVYALYTSDDDRHAGVSDPRTVTVLRTPAAALSIAAPTGVYGDPAAGAATVTVTGAPGAPVPSGSVTVRGETKPLDAAGRAVFDLSLLPVSVGAQTMRAAYSGDDVYAAVESAASTFATTPAATSTRVAGIDSAAPRYGDEVAVSVEVRATAPSTADPQGSVTLAIGSGVDAQTFGPVGIDPAAYDRDGLSTVVVTIPSRALAAGTRTLRATFTATGGTVGSTSDPTTLTVGKAASTTTLTVDPAAAAIGQQVTLTATVRAPGIAGATDRSVAFTAGTSSLGTVSAVPCPGADPDCAVAVLTVAAGAIGIGTTDLVAAFAGSADRSPSSGRIDGFTVSAAAPSVQLTAPGGVEYGRSTPVSVRVSAPGFTPPDGAVVALGATPEGGAPIVLGAIPLVGGAGELTLDPAAAGLVPGRYTLSAALAAGPGYGAASATAPLAVDAAATRISWDPSGVPGSATYGVPFDVPVSVRTVSGAIRPQGDVVLTWNGHELGRAALSSGADGALAGSRTVVVRAVFGPELTVPTDGRLTAAFVPAPGFAAASLGESNPDERVRLVLTPIPVSVAVQMDAALGQPLAATATVTAGAASLGIVPSGQVRFTLGMSGRGSQEIVAAPLVNGRISLADALVAAHRDPIAVDLAGTWSVRATFLPDPADRRILAEPANSTAVVSKTVAAGSSTVSVDAPAAVEMGQTLVVTARVGGAISPTGRVRLELAGSGHVVLSDEVALVDGSARIPLTGPLTRGTLQLRVHYLGDAGLDPADSDPFTVTVGKATSTVTVTSVNTPYPGFVGAKVGYTAHVSSGAGRPAGAVLFLRDGVQIGWAQLAPDQVGGGSSASILITADTVWAGDVVAQFSSADGDTANGEGRFAHSWVKARVTLTLNGSPGAAIGVPTTYTVVARLNWAQFPYLPETLRPPRGPSGTVAVGDGAGGTCTIELVDRGSQLSDGSCPVFFGALGARTVTAVYAGDGTWSAASATPLTTTVQQGTATATLSTPSAVWRGLGTIPVTWSVAGPADGGTVTITRGTETVCTSSALSGSCDVPIPAYDRSQFAGRLALHYSGSPLWRPADATTSGTIDACIPFVAPAPNPAGSATVVVSPAQTTCGTGSSAGYYVSDRVAFAAQPAPGYRVTGFEGAAIDGFSPLPYPAEDITFGSNGSAWMLASPRVFTANGKLVPFTASPVATAQCVTVDVQVAGVPAGSAALNSVFWDTNGRCPQPPTVKNSTTWQVPVEVGSTLRMTYQDAFASPRTMFYGWQGAFSGGAFDRRASYAVTADLQRIVVQFGPVCYAGTPTASTPTGGAIDVSLPAQNCRDPRTGTGGWIYGTRGTATLSDRDGEGLQTTRDYVSQGGSMRWVERSSWVARTPVFFDGWTGDTSRIDEISTTTVTGDDGVRRTVRTVGFSVGEQPFALGARYGQCAVLRTEIRGDASAGAPGRITVGTAPNCPLRSAEGSSWYRTGTSVSLTQTPSGTALKFLGWGGLPSGSGRLLDTTVNVVLSGDVTATASYGTNANCRPLSITSAPAGALALDTTFSLGANACEAMYGSRFYDQGIDGNGITVAARAATPDAQGAEVVFAWSSNAPKSNDAVSSVWQRTDQLNEGFYGPSTVLAYACEFVSVSASVSSPTGALVSAAGATNLVRGSTLDRFVSTQPADCATGSDPKSGYAGYAWQVGTALTPLVVADPTAYRFTGWSGDVKGAGETPDSPLRLVGPGRTAQGEAYHYRVVANFQAICHTLSLPSDADKLEVLTAPNCPGMDASKRMYLGGTAVVLHAPDKGDTLFRNWVRGVDQVDADPRWASVVMNADKTVVPYYSSKSVGEQLSTYGGMVADGMAIASKKMIGLASAAVSAYAKLLLSKVTLVAQGIGYVAQGLELLGVKGAGIDAIKNGASAMQNMIALMWAPLDCLTAWSAGGEGTAIYAAQNAIGTAVVAALSAGAQQQQQAAPTSTLQRLKQQAADAKAAAKPGIQAVQAIAAAKQIYDASASGDIGLESSAYEAWGSQASLSVFSTCMSNRASSTVGSVLAVGG